MSLPESIRTYAVGVSRCRSLIAALTCWASVAGFAACPASAEPQYAIAMHGAPALPADYRQMPYANPDAPKGGRMVQGVLGTFDSLNPFIVRGIAVQQMRGYVVESLMARGRTRPSRFMVCSPKASRPTTAEAS